MDLGVVNRAFVKRTRRGQVKTHVRQTYLRDDLPTGSPFLDAAELEPRLSASASRYLVLDTNVVLHQIDLELDAMGDATPVASDDEPELDESGEPDDERTQQSKRRYLRKNEEAALEKRERDGACSGAQR